ncbi:uncharacterized protein LOC126661884 [Mercurialis annua]|uniref:uncharacterized protein LOC126661884 n=1 Tax=Mercurialis annua TaxID=3986 RepID=UPI00215F2517|nr:uncharacterized protein LOC126661884 [Mercurialis annua]
MANQVHRELRPEESISSPYFLHPGENPSLILVSNVLIDGNYHVWFRAMRMALLSKNKYKFVDGTIPVPLKTDPIHEVWERCNTMVVSWITRSLSPTIAQSISSMDNVVDIWNDLRERCFQGDATRIGDLYEEIYALKQNNMTITEYYTVLKSYWDELMNMRPIPACVCLHRCLCGIGDIVKRYYENDQVIKFLKGLNEKFSQVRSQVIMMEPLAKINKVFSMVAQCERQSGLVHAGVNESNVFYTRGNSAGGNDSYNTVNGNNQSDNVSMTSEANAFYAKGKGVLGIGPTNFKKNSYFNSKKQQQCSYCGFTNHTVDICYKKHGYPPGYQFRNKSSNMVNQVDINSGNQSYGGSGKNFISENTQSDFSRADNGNMQFPFTQEQYAKIMSMIQPNGEGSSSPNHVNALSVTFKPDFTTGNITHTCLQTATNIHDNWIVDTGATYHIICSLDLFDTFKPINDVKVNLPNGQQVTVSHIGEVKLTESLVLHDVLYVPVFSFNLISTSKLTNNLQICLLFHDSLCYIQDIIKWRMIGLAKKRNGLYQLEIKKFLVCKKVFSVSNASKSLWHLRLGHLSNARLKTLQEIDSSISCSSSDECDTCHFSKQKRLSFPLSESVTNDSFE